MFTKADQEKSIVWFSVKNTLQSDADQQVNGSDYHYCVSF